MDNYEIAREPTAEERADPYGLPSSGFIKGATVYRSDDRGGTWTQVSGLTPEQQQLMERHSGTFGWVFGQIRRRSKRPRDGLHAGRRAEHLDRRRQDVPEDPDPGGDHHGLWIDPANSDYLVSAYDQGLCDFLRPRAHVEAFDAHASRVAVLRRLVRHGLAVPRLRVGPGPWKLPGCRGPDGRPGSDPGRGLRAGSGRRGLDARDRSHGPGHRLLVRLLRHPGPVGSAQAARPAEQGAAPVPVPG